VYELFADQLKCRPDKKRLRLAASDIFEVNLETIPIVSNLLAANYRLGILSNTSEPHWDFICDRPYAVIPHYFEVHVLSYEIQVMKPDRRIFEVAAEMAGVSPRSIFFTDDRPENVQGALDAGWNAVLYTSPAELARALREYGVRLNY
jgi:putative hydrolase of the HAD superfamily